MRFYSAANKRHTWAVDSFRFVAPAYVGDLVSCYAELEQRGRTSVRVKVEVFARRDRDPGAEHRIAEASITYVAVDQEGRPRELPAL